MRQGWRALLESADRVCVSAVSCFETAWLVRHNRIEISIPLAEWFDAALKGSGIQLLPLTPQIAESAVNLPEHHRDPQDRIIIATAITHGAQLLSADTKFALYEELQGTLVS